jgi:hypothetical protein
MHKDEIFELLSLEGLKPEWISADNTGFSRTIAFTIMGVNCYITWWANISYISIAERGLADISFTWIQADQNWPNYKKGLRFVTDNGGHFFLAIERHEWQPK